MNPVAALFDMEILDRKMGVLNVSVLHFPVKKSTAVIAE